MTSRESEIRPEFRAHLEWQIASALRREDRFAEPVAGGWPRLRTAIAFVAALAIGAVGMAASNEVQEARQRDALIDAIRTEESLARLRLQLAEDEYRDVRHKFDVGVAPREAVQAAEGQLHAMKARLARIALNLAEIRATAQAPRDDLQAPLVGQRDFVGERLALDLALAQHALIAAEQGLVEAKKRVAVGLAPLAVQLQADVEKALATARLQQLAATLELRKRALSNTLQMEVVAAELRRIELTSEVTQVQRALEAARLRVDAVRTLFSVGRATELELKRAEVELLEREATLKRIREELEKIRK